MDLRSHIGSSVIRQRRVCAVIVFLLLFVCEAAGFAQERSSSAAQATDIQELLRLHETVLAAHRNNDLEAWMNDESEEYILVSRGEIHHPDKQQRRDQLGPYLASTTFHKYADVVKPQVRVSDDGSLGWVIAQVQVVGTQRTADGRRVDFDDTWGWIELYGKTAGGWLRIGNVSNRKPD